MKPGFGRIQNNFLLGNYWTKITAVFFKYVLQKTIISTQVLLKHSLGDKKVIYDSLIKNLKYSDNNGLTYNTGVNITGLFTPAMIRILANGIIIVFTSSRINKVYYSNDNLITIHECTVLGADGNPYVYHTPINVTYPGGYWIIMGGIAEYNDITVVGNYTNAGNGASPINLYYTLDGITWKVFYTFGQNTNYRDDGTAGGGATGNLLGDVTNTLITRHVHAINVGSDGNFYVATGDNPDEMHFLKCIYNPTEDTWVVNDLLNETSRTWQRMRSLGVYEHNGSLYWGSDGVIDFIYNDITYNSRGLYKCAIADVNDPSKHVLVQSLTDSVYAFLNVGKIVFVGLQSQMVIYISTDYGNTFREFQKPVYMTGSVQGVWYNEKYKYFGSSFGNIIEIKNKILPNGSPYNLSLYFYDTTIYLSCYSDVSNEDGYSWERSNDGIEWSEIGRTSSDVITYSDSNVLVDNSYYYRVRSFKGLDYSEYSNIAEYRTNSSNYGNELIVGGDFSSGTNWGVEADWTISDGKANYSNTIDNKKIYQSISNKFEFNSIYKISFDISGVTGNASIFFSNSGMPLFDGPLSAAVSYTNGTSYCFIVRCIATFTTGNSLRINAFNTSSASSFSLDNLSIKKQL